ncbi:hypothetical protein MY1884_009450 [Beauveria asiatica]
MASPMQSLRLMALVYDRDSDTRTVAKRPDQRPARLSHRQRPKGTCANDRLPVRFYIFGGGFMFGATNASDAENFIKCAGRQSQQFIFVGVNYRVGGCGFLGGAEVLKDNSTNLGLRDQRMDLEWVADNIAYYCKWRNTISLNRV